MSTMKDVAKLAGVSASTVSRYLTGSTGVSREKELRIARAIKELNYEPNVLGRSLRNAETKIVLVVMSRLIPQCMQGMLDAARKEGYNILLDLSERNIDRTQTLRAFQNGLVDGIIFQDVRITENVYREISVKIPVVQCGDYTDIPGSDIVSIDNENMAYRMASHLIRKGYDSIAYVYYYYKDGTHGSLVDARERGIMRAVNENGLTFGNEHKIGILWEPNYEKGNRYAEGVRDWLRSVGDKVADCIYKLPQPPRALFCYNDQIAFGCIRALRARGIRIPEDIAVSGFDGQFLPTETDSILSTVVQPFYKIGYEAFSLMVSKLKDRDNTGRGRKILLDSELSLRASTGDQPVDGNSSL
ncbi:MAG: LacI family transcriptional regulator [Clostridiales bacterium]|nr:LacI family transcriptional regulator [Clostridiales bacterium]